VLLPKRREDLPSRLLTHCYSNGRVRFSFSMVPHHLDQPRCERRRRRRRAFGRCARPLGGACGTCSGCRGCRGWQEAARLVVGRRGQPRGQPRRMACGAHCGGNVGRQRQRARRSRGVRGERAAYLSALRGIRRALPYTSPFSGLDNFYGEKKSRLACGMPVCSTHLVSASFGCEPDIKKFILQNK
jgi:hypothetical protein